MTGENVGVVGGRGDETIGRGRSGRGRMGGRGKIALRGERGRRVSIQVGATSTGRGTMGRGKVADRAMVTNIAYLSTQQGGGDINGCRRGDGRVGIGGRGQRRVGLIRRGAMWIRNAASGGTTAIQTYPSTQQRQGRVDGPELPRGNVGVVAAQASDPLSQPPQNRPADLA